MSARLERLIREAGERLPRPGPEATKRARRAALGAFDDAYGGGDRRGARVSPRMLALAAAAVCLVALGAAAGLLLAPSGGASSPTPAVPAAGPGFLPAGGWNTVAAARPDEAFALAANVALRDPLPAGDRPRRTIASLPPEGIVMVASFRPRDVFAPRAAYPRRRLPLSLREATVGSEVGRPRYQLRAYAAGYDVEVVVWFGSGPSPSLLAEAQTQLGRLAVPPITISARPRVLAAFTSPQLEPLTLSGAIASREANEVVTIQASECSFPGWRDVATTHTEGNGAWHARAPVWTKTRFRAKWQTAVSGAVTVQTRPGVQLQPQGRNRWSVGVLAQRSLLDRQGQLQRFDRSRSRWVTIKRFQFTERSRTRGVGVWTNSYFRARVPSGTQLRAYIPRQIVQPCYLAGYSLILTAR